MQATFIYFLPCMGCVSVLLIRDSLGLCCLHHFGQWQLAHIQIVMRAGLTRRMNNRRTALETTPAPVQSPATDLASARTSKPTIRVQQLARHHWPLQHVPALTPTSQLPSKFHCAPWKLNVVPDSLGIISPPMKKVAPQHSKNN